MWLRRWTTKLLWNLKVFPQNSQDLDLTGGWEGGGAGRGGRGGVARKGGLLPGWNGCSNLCIGLGRFGDNGGLEVFPANSRSRLEKSIAGGSMAMGLSRSTLSKALGWWVARAISSAPRRSMRCGSKWCLGGGLNKGGVGGKRPSPRPEASLATDPGILRRLKGLLSAMWIPWSGGCEGHSAPSPDGIPTRGVRGLPWSLSK